MGRFADSSAKIQKILDFETLFSKIYHYGIALRRNPMSVFGTIKHSHRQYIHAFGARFGDHPK